VKSALKVNLKNKANYNLGKIGVSSLKIEYYVIFVPFVAEKNKANFPALGRKSKILISKFETISNEDMKSQAS